MPNQTNVRNNGVNQKNYIATIEHEKSCSHLYQNANKDIMEIDFHRYQLETDRKFENQEEGFLKSQSQLRSLEGQSSTDVLKIDFKEVSLNNKKRRLHYQKNLESEQHSKRKQKMLYYPQKRRKTAKANLKIKQFKL